MITMMKGEQKERFKEEQKTLKIVRENNCINLIK